MITSSLVMSLIVSFHQPQPQCLTSVTNPIVLCLCRLNNMLPSMGGSDTLAPLADQIPDQTTTVSTALVVAARQYSLAVIVVSYLIMALVAIGAIYTTYRLLGAETCKFMLSSFGWLWAYGNYTQLASLVLFLFVARHWYARLKSDGVRWFLCLPPLFLVLLSLWKLLSVEKVMLLLPIPMVQYWNQSWWRPCLQALLAHFLHYDLFHVACNSSVLVGDERLHTISRRRLLSLFLLTALVLHCVTQWAYDYRHRMSQLVQQDSDACLGGDNAVQLFDLMALMERVFGGPYTVSIGFSGVLYALSGQLDGLSRLNVFSILLPMVMFSKQPVSHMGHLVGLVVGSLFYYSGQLCDAPPPSSAKRHGRSRSFSLDY